MGNVAAGALFHAAAVGSSAGKAPFTSGALTAELATLGSPEEAASLTFSSAAAGCTIRNPMARHAPPTTFGTIRLSPRIISSVLSLLTNSLLTLQRVGLCAFHCARSPLTFLTCAVREHRRHIGLPSSIPRSEAIDARHRTRP